MKKCNTGSVLDTYSGSMIDGPGIRTVIFMQGCYLRCKYCHNPESWQLKENNTDAQDLLNKILRNKSYFINGGGVTFSGGEPLVQTEFLEYIIPLIKKHDIHVALETVGITSGDYTKIVDMCDLILLDVKHTTKDGYYDITKGSIDLAIKFRDYLVKTQKEVWIRQVIVPNIHDNVEYLISLKEYIKDLNVKKVEFLPYCDLGREKYKKLGINYPYENVKNMDSLKTKELLEKFLEL